MGLPQEAIDAYLQKESIEKHGNDIEVLEENWDAVRVYQFCKPDVQPAFVMGAGGGYSRRDYIGIDTREIESVCRSLRLDCDELMLVKVRIMAAEAGQILNGS